MFSLEAPFYTSDALFDADMEGIFGQQWIFAASIAEIPESGDYVTVEYGPYSLVLVRDDDGGVNALHNVCRHRGAKVLREKSGTTGNLVCGYHSWTYAPDGKLLHASATGDNFDKNCFALKRAHVRIVAGLVYICLAENPPEDFDAVAEIIDPFLSTYGLGETKIAYQQDLIENGNWKLVVENNRECYHCDGHPELSCSIFPTFGMDENSIPEHRLDDWNRERIAELELIQKCDRYGLPYGILEDLRDRPVGFRVERAAMDGEGESFSTTGKRLSKKLVGDVPEFKLGRVGLHMQPNSWFHFLGDHIITFAVFPIAANQTLIRTIWHVAEDAVEGVDYDLDELTFTWKQTNLQDREFVELCQRGATSPAYEQGPYMQSEYMVDAFVSWYVARMQEHIGTD
ncbi:aromatic ring-hydroxylating oxygenase subunit alpha [Leucobacter sp. GX24907]